MKSKAARTYLAAVFFAAIFLSGATFDMYEAMDRIWEWKKPDPYPYPLEELDAETLSVLLDAGNLQWYEPRPEKGQWDAAVGMKVHAAPQTVWSVITDYEAPCRIMSKTFLECKSERVSDDKVKNEYKIITRVLEFGSTFDMIDEVTEKPPYFQRIETVEGGLEGRVVTITLIPADGGKTTLAFMRYYASMRSLGLAMRAVLAVVPAAEWPVAAASANYHLTTHGMEAERIEGYRRPEKPGDLKHDKLDMETLARLARFNAGLIRETPEGKTVDGLAYAFIDAPPGVVYGILEDLEHYDENLQNQKTAVEKREGNKVWVTQKITSQSVLVFTFSYEMHALYQLDPPYHVSYRAIDGTYEGSTGDFRIVPLDGGERCALFCQIGINFERDSALTTRIIRSGDYPFSTVMDLIAARTYLNSIKPLAEKRAREGG